MVVKKKEEKLISLSFKTILYSLLISGFCGLLCCAVTHTIMTPLEFSKLYKQHGGKKLKGLFEFLKHIQNTYNVFKIYHGWESLLFGYAFQGFFKFSLYEFFKYILFVKIAFFQYVKMLGFILAAITAEAIADLFLKPFDAIRIYMQTIAIDKEPEVLVNDVGFFTAISNVFNEGLLYKDLGALMARQVIYTVLKFVSFEYLLPLAFLLLGLLTKKKKEDYNQVTRLAVGLLAGFTSGAFGSLASQPCDKMIVAKDSENAKKNKILLFFTTFFSSASYTGWAERVAIVGLATAFQLAFYNLGKDLMGAKPLFDFSKEKKNK